MSKTPTKAKRSPKASANSTKQPSRSKAGLPVKTDVRAGLASDRFSGFYHS